MGEAGLRRAFPSSMRCRRRTTLPAPWSANASSCWCRSSRPTSSARCAWSGPQPGVRVELACDRGEIRAGKRSERVAEVELERKEGSAAAFYHYAMQWARLHQAQLVLPSKSLRGLQLAGLADGEAKGASSCAPRSPAADLPVAAGRAADPGAGTSSISSATSRRCSPSTEPEGPHQLRVALRRFRAAIRFLDLRHASLAAGRLDRRRRCVGDLAGPRPAGPCAGADAAAFVRDADVLETGLLASLEHDLPGRRCASRPWPLACHRARTRARARLRAAMQSSRPGGLRHPGAGGSRIAAGGPLAGRRPSVSSPPLAWPALRRAAPARPEREGRGESGTRCGSPSRTFAMRSTAAGPWMSPRSPIGEAVAALSHWQSRSAWARTWRSHAASPARRWPHTAAPTAMTVRAAALIDGYRACALPDRGTRKAARPDPRHAPTAAGLAAQARPQRPPGGSPRRGGAGRAGLDQRPRMRLRESCRPRAEADEPCRQEEDHGTAQDGWRVRA